MSDLLSGLMNQFGGDALSQISKSIGSDEKSTQAALGSVLPVLVSALAKNASTPEGAVKLSNALAKDHDGGVLDNLSGFLGGGSAEGMGSSILNHVLGGKTSAVENALSQQTGMDSSAISSIIKMAAPVVMGYLGKQNSALGSNSNGLSSLLDEAVTSNKSNAPEGQNFIENLLDQNNDGNVMDDVTKLGMSFLGNMFKK